MLFRFASFVLLAIACATPALSEQISLPGQVTYRERIALPELATLRIQLVDQTLAGRPRVDVEAPTGAGQVPLSFVLGFEDSIILPGHDYALIATISAESGMLFRNTEPYPVTPLAQVEPVMVVVNLVGQIADAPVVEETAATGQLAILESTWMATSIAGTPVVARSTTSLQIGTDLRAGGSGGCNGWFTQVEIDGDAIRFGGITSTMKACGQARNLQEKAFYEALGAAATWRVTGDELTLFGADGNALVVFTR
jgi:putative lipoprotein